MLKTTEGEFLTGLVAIGEDNIIQLGLIKKCNAIDIPFTEPGIAIEEFDINSNEIDKVDVIEVNSTKVSKSVKYKDLI